MNFLIGRLINYCVDDVFYQAESASNISHLAQKAVKILDSVPSMSQCHDRDFKWSRPIFTLVDRVIQAAAKLDESGIAN